MSNDAINFNKWLQMSREERIQEYQKWNVYNGEGKEIVQKINEAFKDKYGMQLGFVINEPCINQGGDWVLSVSTVIGDPILDIPTEFLGIGVIRGFSGLSQELRKKLSEKFSNNIETFAKEELPEFKKYFPFMNNPDVPDERSIEFIKNYVLFSIGETPPEWQPKKVE